jgi:hypothetical protein
MRTPTGLTLSVVMGLSTVVLGQTAATRPAAPAASGRYVAIGCISRQGTTAAPRYVITDPRGGTPTVYRLDGSAAMLEPHVGHTVEVAGPIVSAAGATTQTLKVNSIVWLASACKK